MRTWFHGLLAAAISAAASGVSLVIVAPLEFNFSRDGLLKLASVCGVNALISAAAYLKQSPLPGDQKAPTP